MIVHYTRKTRPSALLLAPKLRAEGYTGPVINWGNSQFSSPGNYQGLNHPAFVAKAVNKRMALQLMAEAGVPIPAMYKPIYSDSGDDVIMPQIPADAYPIVGRPDAHSKGRYMYMCNTLGDAIQATRRRRPATHFLQWIIDAREFRVYVVNGQSIKISEKIGGGNHDRGAIFEYPHGFTHKLSLRKHAKAAVEALGLDFGAVDLLYTERDNKWYVLEVNTAPCLTDETSDTLQCYVDAFMELSSE